MPLKTVTTKYRQYQNAIHAYQIEILSRPLDGLIFSIKKFPLKIGRENTNDLAISYDLMI